MLLYILYMTIIQLIKSTYNKWRYSASFRSMIVLVTLGGASQVLGMIRDRILADKIGVGEMLDMYYAAFKVPDFIYAILLSVIAGVTVIPLLSKSIHDKNWKEVSYKYSSLFNFFSIVTFVLCGIVYLCMPEIINLIFPHTTSAWQLEVSSLSRLMMIQPIILNIANMFSTLAMAESKFFTYALAPLFYNIGIISGVLVLYDSYGAKGLVLGVILGALLSLIIQSISFWSSKVRVSLFTIDWKVIKEELLLSMPRSMSLIMLQARGLFIASVATMLGVGALSSYTFAYNFFMLPITAIGISYVTVIFPRISALYESGRYEEFDRRIANDIYILMLLTIPTTFVFYFFSSQIVALIYPHLKDIKEIPMMLSTLSTTLPLYILSLYYVRVSFARRDPISPLISQSISVIVVIITSYLLYHANYGYLSIVYAFNAGLIIEFLIMYFLFYSKKNKNEY